MIAARARELNDWWRGLDRTLLFVVFALICVGLVLSLAASPTAAERIARAAGLDASQANPFIFLYKQIFFAGASVA
ncbi:MAG TPA: hypothetical protein DCQ53_04770, partial [Alphaproteobacteria bacterium]|nr:hypothetical protein [Alphaproteobacteria bacterium]